MSLEQNLKFSSEKNIIAGKYEVISIVGRGRNSVVYKAKSLEHGFSEKKEIFVALKILPLTEKKSLVLKSRMKRESLSMLASKHHNVIRLYDFISDNENCILVMEYADSGDLRQLLEKRNSGLTIDLALDFMIQTLNGLEHLHQRGIIHRDLKPDNLLLINNYIIKIADFSVADIPKSEFKVGKADYSNSVGTIDYIAPEVLNNGKSSVVSDIFSMGVTFYQLITNKLPFEATSFAEHINLKVNGIYEPASSVIKNIPPEIDKIIAKAMAINPAERYQSPREFIQAIENFRKFKQKSELFNLDKFAIKSDFGNLDLLLEEDNKDHEIADSNKKKRKNNFGFKLNKNKTFYKMLAGCSICFFIIMAIAFSFIEFNLGNSLAKESNKTNNNEAEQIEQEANEALELPTENVLPEIKENVVDNSSVFSNLATNNYIGIFKKLYSDGTDERFSSGPNIDSTKLILQVPFAGWENVEIDMGTLVKKRSVILEHAGMKIELNFENAKIKENNVITAQYKDLLSGKSGELIFK